MLHGAGLGRTRDCVARHTGVSGLRGGGGENGTWPAAGERSLRPRRVAGAGRARRGRRSGPPCGGGAAARLRGWPGQGAGGRRDGEARGLHASGRSRGGLDTGHPTQATRRGAGCGVRAIGRTGSGGGSPRICPARLARAFGAPACGRWGRRRAVSRRRGAGGASAWLPAAIDPAAMRLRLARRRPADGDQPADCRAGAPGRSWAGRRRRAWLRSTASASRPVRAADRGALTRPGGPRRARDMASPARKTSCRLRRLTRRPSGTARAPSAGGATALPPVPACATSSPVRSAAPAALRGAGRPRAAADRDRRAARRTPRRPALAPPPSRRTQPCRVRAQPAPRPRRRNLPKSGRGRADARKRRTPSRRRATGRT